MQHAATQGGFTKLQPVQPIPQTSSIRLERKIAESQDFSYAQGIVSQLNHSMHL